MAHTVHEQHHDVHTEPVPEHILHSMDAKTSHTKNTNTIAIWLVYGLLILLGIGTGYLLSSQKMDTTYSASNVKTSGANGSINPKDALDPACPVGSLEAGGIGNEGTHKLIRDGGPSQTAYLISSVVDLDEYIGKKVRVCGATLAAKKAPWLMDVEKIAVQ
jgi:hypothetical protein